jgi:conjugative relaxase-like TrwC/TraI family protein
MLRITQQNNATAAKRYYSTADYYSEGQEIVGRWGGNGARKLGLEGIVDRESFERLCDNMKPASGQQLTARTRTERTVGYDFTFSVPKSVSLLYALSGDQEVLEAFRDAVDETMRDIETEMKTRIRRAGRDTDRQTGNMTWAEFIHTTSRPVDGLPDPQLHAHCFAFNSTWDEEERRWKAGQFRGLKADAPYFQAAFRVRLANRLQDLGLAIDRKRDDFELAGMPADLLARFSRRTEEIERVAAELGITDPKRKAELGAETREGKNEQISWNQLRNEWDQRLSPQERAAIADVHRREKSAARAPANEAGAVDHALNHCFERESVVPERKLLTEALKRGLGGVTVNSVQQELESRPLIRGVVEGKAVASTGTVLDEEQRLIQFARKGRGRFRPLGDATRELARGWLNAGQQAAVRHVLESRDRITIIRGIAGTGKTTLMQEAVEQLQHAGRSVTVLAPSVKASKEVLRDEGFADANTVAKFLKDTSMQKDAEGQVVWVDEAGLLGTKDMLRLFDTVRDVGARLILSGDRKQHRGVARGEPLKLLEKKAGVPVAMVSDIMRQSGSYRDAVAHLSEGRIAEGFEQLDRLGWIQQVDDASRDQALANAYLASVRERKRNGDPVTALVVSPTHAEASRITDSIRAALKDSGRLKKERKLDTWVPLHLTAAQKTDAANYQPGYMIQFHQNAPGRKIGTRLIISGEEDAPVEFADRFEVYRPQELAIGVGDRVRVSAGGKTKDGKHILSNGSLLNVQGFSPQGDLVVDHGWTIDKGFGHLAHGYVVTSHASQGKTVDRVFVGQSSVSIPASNRRQFYVSVSRGKSEATIFTDDKGELLKAIRKQDEPLSATELAGMRRPKAPLRLRFQKQLARVRRMANAAWMHELRRADQERSPAWQKEREHAR